MAGGPPHPPVTTLILGPAKPPQSGPFGAEFLRFFGPCGAKSWGGGGAPPTTLILLRNQFYAQSRRAAALHDTPGAPSGARQQAISAKITKNAKFCNFCFFAVVVERCALERGERGGVSSIRCANVSHGRGPLRSPRPCP